MAVRRRGELLGRRVPDQDVQKKPVAKRVRRASPRPCRSRQSGQIDEPEARFLGASAAVANRGERRTDGRAPASPAVCRARSAAGRPGTGRSSRLSVAQVCRDVRRSAAGDIGVRREKRIWPRSKKVWRKPARVTEITSVGAAWRRSACHGFGNHHRHGVNADQLRIRPGAWPAARVRTANSRSGRRTGFVRRGAPRCCGRGKSPVDSGVP